MQPVMDWLRGKVRDYLQDLLKELPKVKPQGKRSEKVKQSVTAMEKQMPPVNSPVAY